MQRNLRLSQNDSLFVVEAIGHVHLKSMAVLHTWVMSTLV